MKTQILSILSVILVGSSACFAGGEYDKFHFGPRLGLTWSPSKDYAVQGDGQGNSVDGGRQLGLSGGLEVRWNLSPGRLRLALGADYIRTLGKEAKKDAPQVNQDIIRGQLRLIIAGRANTEPGMYTWIGPTINRVHTNSSDLIPTAKETVYGGTVGIGTHRFYERSLAFYEFGAYYSKATKLETKSGDLTLEVRMGLLF